MVHFKNWKAVRDRRKDMTKPQKLLETREPIKEISVETIHQQITKSRNKYPINEFVEFFEKIN